MSPVGTVEVSVAPLVATGAAAAILVFTVLALVAATRRLRAREMRDLSAAIEDLRSGRLRRKVDLEPRSPFLPIGESIGRLALDLALRLAEADSSVQLTTLLSETLRDRAVVMTDGDGDVRSVSAGGAALFGWDPDAVRGRPIATLFVEEAWRDLLPRPSRKDLRDVGIDCGGVVRRRDGTNVPVRLAIRLVRRGATETSGMLFVQLLFAVCLLSFGCSTADLPSAHSAEIASPVMEVPVIPDEPAQDAPPVTEAGEVQERGLSRLSPGVLGSGAALKGTLSTGVTSGYPGEFAIRTPRGYYFTAANGGGRAGDPTVFTGATSAGAWERFKLAIPSPLSP